MSRMGKDGVSSGHSTRLSIRVSPDLKDRLKEYAEAHGQTMTEVAVEAIEEAVGQEAPQRAAWLPEDDQLAEAWHVLDRHAPPHTRTLSVDLATTLLAQSLNLPKKTIRETILDPLRAHEPTLVTANWGTLRIHRPTGGQEGTA